MSDPRFEPERILDLLTEADVDFVVIGGVAASLHGSPRVTLDLDIRPARAQGNLDVLGEVLLALGARPYGVPDDVPFVADGQTLRRMEILTLNTTEGKLDVIAEPPGAPSYEVMRAQAQLCDVDAMLVPIASIDHLIAMKRAAGRLKDLADIAELEAIQRLQQED